MTHEEECIKRTWEIMNQYKKGGVKYNKTQNVGDENNKRRIRETKGICGVATANGEIVKDENGKLLHSYKTWLDMINRCYNEKIKQRYETYKNVTCCDEWLHYKNFKKWYDENYYEIEGQQMNLDKDILMKGNKVYSPKTCIFVPKRINTLFTKCNSKRGKLPIGVYYDNSKKKYRACCNDGSGRTKKIGTYSEPKVAFWAYKAYKRDVIREIANEYKSEIPKKLYNAMLNYKIEIDD